MLIDWLPATIRGISRRTQSWLCLPRARQRRNAGVPFLEALEARVLPVLGLNIPPVCSPDTYIVTQDTPFNGTPGVLANDLDLDGDTLHAVLVTNPLNGSLTLNDNGTFTYTPASGFFGVDTFTYRANDGQANSLLPGVVTLIVNPLPNSPPVANDDVFNMAEDAILNLSLGTPLFGVLANDTDADIPDLLELLNLGEATLLANLVSTTQYGTLTFLPTGTFIYTPGENFHGIDTFTYQASDGLSLSNVATATINVGSLNDAPISVLDVYGTDEDTPLNVAAAGVLANDLDLDGDSLTAAIVSTPVNGSVTLNPNGSFVYTPNPNFNGIDTFTYQASDGTESGLATLVTIVVNPVHDTPVAVDDFYSIDEDALLPVLVAAGVLNNDVDADGLVLTAAVVAAPQHGSLIFLPTGAFTYVPDPNFNGTDSFTYQAADLTSNSNIATVTITVNGVNDEPVAGNDSYNTNEDQALVITAGGVLANDSDIEGNLLTAVLVDQPLHGSLALDASGSFTYTPFANYFGADSFTYLAVDGLAESIVATVNLTVNSLNDGPVSVNDAYNVDEDSALSIPALTGLLSNDSDADSDPLTALVATLPQHGTLNLQADGSFVYTPNADYSGSDSFTYRVLDLIDLSGAATVSLTINPINDAPVAASNLYATVVDTPLVVSAVNGVLTNDTDIDSPTLTAAVVSTTQFGSLVLNADGSFTYTPDTSFLGIDSFIYQASDGSILSGLTLVTISVSAGANLLPIAADDVFQLQEDGTLDLTAGTALDGVLGNDTDADFPIDPALQLTASLVSSPQHGTLVFQTNGTFSYTPLADYFGTDTFTYLASDALAFSNVVTVTLNILAANDAPATVGDSYSLQEDTSLVVPAAGVLTNDTDVDLDGLLAVLIDGPAHGNVSLNADGSFSYTPVANYSGPDSFTYRANDGTVLGNVATVGLTVIGANDVPLAVGDSYQVNEDAVLTVSQGSGVLFNDSDVDGNTLTVGVVAQPLNGTLSLSANGSFVYTPDANFNGTDTFTYQVSDGLSLSTVATVTIGVEAVNDGPTAANDGYTVAGTALVVNMADGVLANDVDPDLDALTASLGTSPLNGQVNLNSNGSFTYTPNDGFIGFDSFTYRANDGTALSPEATVIISVTSPPNQAPVANGDNYSTAEDALFATTLANGVLVNDTDVDGDTLTATLVSGPAHGILVLNANGTFSYTPQGNYSGPDSFTYQARDGELNSGLATVNLTVTAVNDTPVSLADSYNVNENQTLIVTGPGVLLNDTDADLDLLTAELMSLPLHGVLVLNSDGSFTYTPSSNYFGPDSFTYRASDGTANSGATTVNLSVNGSNHLPVLAGDAYSIAEDNVLTVAAIAGLLSNDSDVDGNTLSAAVVIQPTHGTVAVSADGSFIYTPDADFNGTDTFSYAASDGTATGTAAVVTITITAVNDTPTGADDAYTTAEDAVLTVAAGGVLSNDLDTDGNPLTAVLATGPAHGTLTLNGDGSFVYTPDPQYIGNDSFTYRTHDGTTTGNLTTVALTVTLQNDSPVVITSNGDRTAKGKKRIVLDTAVDVTDEDSPTFDAGQLNVVIQSGAGAKDRLSFGKGGAKKGFVTAKRGVVRVGQVEVGTMTGGLRGVPIQVTLNSNATLSRVKAIAQSVLFRGSSRQPGVRVVSVQVTDDTNQTSNLALKSVNVT